MSFDIKEHEWDDSQIEVAGTCSLPMSGELIFFNHGAHRFAISKSDAIAMAKHFGLIKENYEQQQETMKMLREAHPTIVSEVLLGATEPKEAYIFNNAHEDSYNSPFERIPPINWYDIPSTEVKPEFSHAGEKMAYDHVWRGYWARDKS